MSGRNYKPDEGLLGKFRDSFETPPDMPDVNVDGVLDLQHWRVDEFKKPILDDLLAWYRFDPVDTETAKKYVGEPRRRAVGREAVKEMIANRDEVVAAGQRQVVHIAENTESTLAMFWMIAEGRKAVLEETLSGVIKEVEIDPSVAYQAAEAIEDMGHCIYQPFEPKWDKDVRKVIPDEDVLTAVESFAPGVGEQVIGFGKHAADNQAALRTDTGIILMQSALEEQEYRIAAWQPRHEAITTAFPGIEEESMDVLLGRVPLDEMIRYVDRKRLEE